MALFASLIAVGAALLAVAAQTKAKHGPTPQSRALIALSVLLIVAALVGLGLSVAGTR